MAPRTLQFSGCRPRFPGLSNPSKLIVLNLSPPRIRVRSVHPDLPTNILHRRRTTHLRAPTGLPWRRSLEGGGRGPSTTTGNRVGRWKGVQRQPRQWGCAVLHRRGPLWTRTRWVVVQGGGVEDQGPVVFLSDTTPGRRDSHVCRMWRASGVPCFRPDTPDRTSRVAEGRRWSVILVQ